MTVGAAADDTHGFPMPVKLQGGQLLQPAYKGFS